MALGDPDSATVEFVARRLHGGFIRDTKAAPRKWSDLETDEKRPWILAAIRAHRALGEARPIEETLDDYYGRTFSAHCAAVHRLSALQQRKLGKAKVVLPRHIEVRRNDRLPRLAWLCSIEDASFAFSVGAGVEHDDARIVEGVWAGDFATSRIEDSDCVFGSGAAIGGRQVIFVPPKHNYEHLFVLHDRTRQRTVVSNSLCCTLAAGGPDAVAAFLALVPGGLMAIDRVPKEGIDRYEPVICEDERFRLLRMMYYNFSADHTGAVQLHGSAPPSPPGDFAEYRGSLSRQVGDLFANARARERAAPFEPIAAVSRGYDSTASATLAKEHGCRDALTLDVTVADFDDSGAAIADALGLRLSSHRHVMGATIERLRIDFEGPLRDAVTEFIATQGVGDDIAFLAFEPRLSARLLVTGGYGDGIWARTSTLQPGLPANSVFSKSITEFRLRVGFAYLPLPFIGARFPQAVVAISQSEEMRPYSVAKRYDRPIPRRIAEEAGIPRGAFGVKKAATSPLPTNHEALFPHAIRQIVGRYLSAGVR